MFQVDKLSIRQKILLVAAVGCIGIMFNLLFYAWTSYGNDDRLSAIHEQFFPILEQSDRAIVVLDDLGSAMRLAIGDIENLEDAHEFVWVLNERLDSIVEIEASQTQAVDEVRKNLLTYVQNAASFAQRADADEVGDFADEAETVNRTMITLATSLTDYREQNFVNFITAIDEAQSTAQFAVWLTFAVSILTICAVIYIGRIIASLMTSNLTSLAEFANRVAHGDLESKIQISSLDEIGQLSGTRSHRDRGSL